MDIELIQHINVDVTRLIKIINEVNVKFKALNVKKGVHNVLLQSIEKCIWNWMDTYPKEFVHLMKAPNQDLEDACDKMFELLDQFAESSNKRRLYAWPLQMLLLVLSPKILEEIINADSGMAQQFLDLA